MPKVRFWDSFKDSRCKTIMSNTAVEFNTTCSYLAKNPLWHTEESCWKAEHVLRMIKPHKIVPKTIGEVGCGAGEVLKQLQLRLDKECDFLGCDISPRAIELCRSRANESILSSWMLRKFRRAFP
jgi:ubiquinone/menaquinone biosynthesis C-methylase UbiE